MSPLRDQDGIAHANLSLATRRRGGATRALESGLAERVTVDRIADCKNRTLAPRHPAGPVLALR